MPSLLLITWKNGRPVKTYGVNQVKIYNMKFTFICSVIVISYSVSASGDLEIYPGLKFNLNSEERRSRLENYDDTNFYNDYKAYPWNNPENDYGERKDIQEYELTLPERIRQFEEVINWEKAQLNRHNNHHVQYEKSSLPYEMRENTYSNLRDFNKHNDFKNVDNIYAPILQDVNIYNPEEDFTFKNEDNDIDDTIQKPFGSILDDDGRFQSDKHSSLQKIRASEENSMTGTHHAEHEHQLTREEQFPSGTYKNVKIADDPSEFAYPPSDPRFYEKASAGSKMDISAGKKINLLDTDATTSGKVSIKARSDKKLRDDEEGLIDNFHFKTLNSEDTSRNGVADIVAVKSNISDVNSAGVYIIAIVAGISAAATVGLIAVGIGWYNLQKHVKNASDVEYPAYGVTGPNKDISPSGDRRLAQSAQMYHYQHQKQQILAMERAPPGDRHGSVSEADSDEENEEGDYTVYECPGLAPAGEMEVKNPLFQDDPTPAQTTPSVKTNEETK